MACFHPLTGARYPGSRMKPVFGSAIEAGMTKFPVRCGQCIGCRLDHSLMWAARAVHESRLHQSNCFVTLTYSDQDMPQPPSVSKRPLQLFFKNLRYYTKAKIKYLACGEYTPKKTRPVGPFNPWEYIGEGQRPHYHALIFGYDFPDQKLWSVRNGNSIYTSDFLTDIWGKGHCTVGALTFETAAYVARYSLKKINGKLEKKPDPVTGLLPYERVCPVTGNITEVEKERFHMSNGLGKEFYNKYRGDMYPGDTMVINGYARKPPRYYDNLYDAEEPDLLEAIKDKRIEEFAMHEADQTPARLKQREEVKLAQISQLKRVLE